VEAVGGGGGSNVLVGEGDELFSILRRSSRLTTLSIESV
jgi:hypothetical protein